MAWEYILFDIETDGLNPKFIHMISMSDLITMERKSFVGLDEVCKAIQILDEAKMVAGHAIIFFDCAVIEKMTEDAVTFPALKTVDTLEMSRSLAKDMRAHGLKAWGEKLGFPKLEQPDFDKGFTEEWIPYCERDVDLNVKVFFLLLERLLEEYQQDNLPQRWSALTGYLAEAAAQCAG